MTAEGTFPKIDGDIFYASEANRFASDNEVASGVSISVAAGSSTAGGVWAGTSTGSLDQVTNYDNSTFWAGSWLGPTNSIGSIVLTLPRGSFRNAVIYAGSLTGTGTSGQKDFTLKVQDPDTGSSTTLATLTQPHSITGSKFDNFAVHKTGQIVYETSRISAAGSNIVKLFNIQVL